MPREACQCAEACPVEACVPSDCMLGGRGYMPSEARWLTLASIPTLFLCVSVGTHTGVCVSCFSCSVCYCVAVTARRNGVAVALVVCRCARYLVTVGWEPDTPPRRNWSSAMSLQCSDFMCQWCKGCEFVA